MGRSMAAGRFQRVPDSTRRWIKGGQPPFNHLLSLRSQARVCASPAVGPREEDERDGPGLSRPCLESRRSRADGRYGCCGGCCPWHPCPGRLLQGSRATFRWTCPCATPTGQGGDGPKLCRNAPTRLTRGRSMAAGRFQRAPGSTRRSRAR